MSNITPVITIDGLASSGKSTVSKKLSQIFISGFTLSLFNCFTLSAIKVWFFIAKIGNVISLLES